MVLFMGKAGGDRGRSFEPPVADYRRKVGNFTRKTNLRVEQKETLNRAIAKKQEAPLPLKQLLLSLTIFGAVCGLLYAYLNYVLYDDESEFTPEEIAAAMAAEARARLQREGSE